MPRPLLSWPLHEPPVVVCAGRFPLADRGFPISYLCPTHALHLHEMGGTLRRGGRDEPLVPGMLTLSIGGVPTLYDLEGPQRMWCIHFDPATSGAAAASAPLPAVVQLGPHRAYVAERMSRIAALSVPGSAPVALAAASAALLELLLLISQLSERAATPERVRSDQAVAEAAALIDEHACEALDVRRLAARVGMSQQRLARRFRERHGMTLQRYQLACRIEQARHLLSRSDIAVHELAGRLGFSDVQHFSKRFIQVAGMTPGRYREGERARGGR